MIPPNGDNGQPGALLDRFLEAVEEQGSRVAYQRDDRAKAQCPAHDDHDPSLSVRYDEETDALWVKCFTGCTVPDVVAAVGWTMRDLFGSGSTPRPKGPRREPTLREAMDRLLDPTRKRDERDVAVVMGRVAERADQEARDQAQPWLRALAELRWAGEVVIR